MRDGYRVYDTHTHIGTARHSGRRQPAQDLLAAMDRFGIDRSVAIPFPVVEDYRAEHDEIAAAVQSAPSRLVGCACIPVFVPEREFRAEVRRCAVELGFRALKLQPMYQALNPVSSRSDFLFEAAAEHGMTVIVHTGTGVPFSLPSLYIWKARRFPGLRIVLGHAGGSVYMHECIVAADVCPNIFVELSSLMPHHAAEILAHVPPDRLIAGSDLIESIDAELGKFFTMAISEGARRDILWNTAERLFG